MHTKNGVKANEIRTTTRINGKLIFGCDYRGWDVTDQGKCTYHGNEYIIGRDFKFTHTINQQNINNDWSVTIQNDFLDYFGLTY